MTNFKSHKGFSLVELIVVIAIISILSYSSVVGFGYLGDILKVNEVSSLLKDVIKQEELKVLRGDFVGSTINFYKDYLVIEQELKDSSLKLTFEESTSSCFGQYQLKLSEAGNLKQWDKAGKVLNIKSVKKSETECVDFKSSDKIALNYQLIDSGKFSNIIEFVHFNLNRYDLKNPFSITEGSGSKIEINAPYGKKYIYGPKGTLHIDPNNPVQLVIEDKNKNSSNTFILE